MFPAIRATNDRFCFCHSFCKSSSLGLVIFQSFDVGGTALVPHMEVVSRETVEGLVERIAVRRNVDTHRDSEEWVVTTLPRLMS
jgi:hypothetical protein